MLDLLSACLAALDPLWVTLLPMVGISLFGNFSESDSQQKSNSGFNENEKSLASVTAYDGLANLFTSADDFYRRKSIPQFTMSERFPGLFKEQEGFANAFANNLFSKASGTTAARGQLSPLNFSNVVGSALTNAAPTLLPLIGQNLQNQMLLPEQIRTQRIQNVLSPLQALIQGLGSNSSGSGSSMSVGGGGSYGGDAPKGKY